MNTVVSFSSIHLLQHIVLKVNIDTKYTIIIIGIYIYKLYNRYILDIWQYIRNESNLNCLIKFKIKSVIAGTKKFDWIFTLNQ